MDRQDAAFILAGMDSPQAGDESPPSEAPPASAGKPDKAVAAGADAAGADAERKLRVRSACVECHERKLCCIMLDGGSCRNCLSKGRICEKRVEKKRGRPRIVHPPAAEIAAVKAARTAPAKPAISGLVAHPPLVYANPMPGGPMMMGGGGFHPQAVMIGGQLITMMAPQSMFQPMMIAGYAGHPSGNERQPTMAVPMQPLMPSGMVQAQATLVKPEQH